jgi:hypothetical protein
VASSSVEPSPVLIERHPFDYDLPARFPNRRLLAEFFSGAAYAAEDEGRYYLVFDESVMVERVIPDTEPIINSLIGIYAFTTPSDRDAFARAQGWMG